jgi:hypothetical protein
MCLVFPFFPPSYFIYRKKRPPKGAKSPAYQVIFLARLEVGFVLNNSFNTSMPSLTAI